MSQNQQVPIAEGLFTWPSNDPHLIGTREKSTGRITFPPIKRYGEEQEARYEDVELAQRGTLWTWTIQRFLPKLPPYAGPETTETFKPYPVGYVELPGEVKVESRLVDCDPEDLKIGMEMELVITKFKEDDAGNDVMMFAFRPAK